LLIAAVGISTVDANFHARGRPFNDPRLTLALGAGSEFGFCYVQFPGTDERIGLRQRQSGSKKSRNENTGSGEQPTARTSLSLFSENCRVTNCDTRGRM
jgi:hypothetical protein